MASQQPITPAFAWAHPDFDSVTIRKEEDAKTIFNPLMQRNPIDSQESEKKYVNHDLARASDKVGLISCLTSENSNLRQRRKSSNERAIMLPPTKSLTEGFVNSAIEQKRTSNNEIVIWSNTNEKKIVDYWVLIYGFSSMDHYAEVMRRFSAFGTITNRRSGKSNWVALQYESSLEVEKALCQKQCFLADGTLIGVCRMNENLRDSLNWTKSQDDGERPGYSRDVAIQEEDLYLEYPRHRKKAISICERLLAIIFGWEEDTHWL